MREPENQSKLPQSQSLSPSLEIVYPEKAEKSTPFSKTPTQSASEDTDQALAFAQEQLQTDQMASNDPTLPLLSNVPTPNFANGQAALPKLPSSTESAMPFSPLAASVNPLAASSNPLAASPTPSACPEVPAFPASAQGSSPFEENPRPTYVSKARQSRRIPDDLIERIKREVDLVALVRAYGVELKGNGNNLLGLCPFHADTHPSLVITPAKNLWHCMGACNMGGSVIDWVMKTQRIGFRHAVEILRERYGYGSTEEERPPLTERVKLSSPVEASSEDATLLQQVVAYYHATLQRTPAALQYLASRGIGGQQVITEFQLGFADRTLGFRLPSKASKSGRELRERLQRIGLLRASGHEHFAGSVVFPLFSENGTVTGIYGRKIAKPGDLREGTPVHLYLSGPHKGFFHPKSLLSKEIIVCEAIIDALTFWVHGYREVTSAYGTNGFTEEMGNAFVAHGVRKVYLAFDGDEGGDKAALEVAERLGLKGIPCWRVQFPAGMDANEFACQKGFESQWLGELLKTAVPCPPLPIAYSIPLLSGPGEERTGSPLLAAPSETEKEKRSYRVSLDSLSRLATHGLAKEGLNTGQSQVLGGTLENPDQASPIEETGDSPVPSVVPSLATQEVPVAQAQEKDHFRLPSSFSSLAAKEELAAKRENGTEGETSGFTQAAVSSGISPVAIEEKPVTPGQVPPALPPAQGSVQVQVKGEDLLLTLGPRQYRVRGLDKNLSFDVLRINLRVSLADRYHIDTLDLYNARQRAAFIQAAAQELGIKEPEVFKEDLGKILLKLEELQEQKITRTLQPQKKPDPMTESERRSVEELLHSPHLLTRIAEDFERCGLIGERTNALVGYLSSISRKLDDPLALIVQSSSAAGKSSLMEAVLSFIPPEERVKYTAMTGQSLFYMGETDLKHKTLAISEEEGAERASYAIKTMQSERHLSIASTGKDPKTGKMVTHEYQVEGPVQFILTTTAIEIDEELQNRCLVLTINEERAQTQAIHRLQRERETLAGMLQRRERETLSKLHQNAQRMLRPLVVVNPYAQELTFLHTRLRTRRDHLKYLTLIRVIALLHQYQRPVQKTARHGETISYLEATLKDIETANYLVNQVMGTSLDDCSPQTRWLLQQLYQMSLQYRETNPGEKFYFTRRDVHTYTGWGHTQLKVHLARLVDFEYLSLYRESRNSPSLYQLIYQGEGQDGSPFLVGLIDVATLRQRWQDKSSSTTEGGRGKT